MSFRVVDGAHGFAVPRTSWGAREAAATAISAWRARGCWAGPRRRTDGGPVRVCEECLWSGAAHSVRGHRGTAHDDARHGGRGRGGCGHDAGHAHKVNTRTGRPPTRQRRNLNMQTKVCPHRGAHAVVVHRVTSPRAGAGKQGPPAHPPELTYPCCLPALGEFGEMVPHGGSDPYPNRDPGPARNRVPSAPTGRDDRHPGAIRRHHRRSGILLGLPASGTSAAPPGGFA